MNITNKLFTKYVIFFRYGNGEDYEVWYVSDSFAECKKEFKDQVCDWFSTGPDDISQVWCVKFKNLTQDLVDGLVSKDRKVSKETLNYICNPDSTHDSWGWDRNKSKYFDKDLYEVDGPDGLEYLAELIDNGTIPVESDEVDPYDYLYELSSEEFKSLLQKYYKPSLANIIKVRKLLLKIR